MGVVVTNNGLNILLDRFAKSDDDATYSPVTKLYAGMSQTEPVITDTDLTQPLPIITGSVETADDCETADWTEGTDTIAETLNSTSYKEGSNSLNLGKDGTTGTVFSYSKTTTSVDFTSKTLHVWAYVDDITDLVASGTAITVRFGSDSSNYYYKDFNITSIADGWNLLIIEQSTASSTGSPTVAACDYSYIAFNTDLAADTVTLGDVRMDYWHVASSDDYAEGMTTGYPSGPDSNYQLTLRAEILDTEMNGYLINGFAWKNTDSTPAAAMIGKTITIGKDASEQVIVVGKLKLRHT